MHHVIRLHIASVPPFQLPINYAHIGWAKALKNKERAAIFNDAITNFDSR